MGVQPGLHGLYETLSKLVAEGRSGRLQVSHWPGREGVIGLSDGRIVHCQVGRFRGREALEFLSNWMSISLSFYENVESLVVDVEDETQQLLSLLEQRDQEFRKIRTVVPGPEAVFALSPEAQDGRVTVNGKLWKVVALVNGRNSVKDICLSLKANEFSVSRILAYLANRGIIKMLSAQKPLDPTVAKRFLGEMEELLAAHIGPIAPVIIQDTLAEMGKNLDYLNREDLPVLVERISDLIEEEPAKVEFQRAMLGVIQKILRQKETA